MYLVVSCLANWTVWGNAKLYLYCKWIMMRSHLSLKKNLKFNRATSDADSELQRKRVEYAEPKAKRIRGSQVCFCQHSAWTACLWWMKWRWLNVLPLARSISQAATCAGCTCREEYLIHWALAKICSHGSLDLCGLELIVISLENPFFQL